MVWYYCGVNVSCIIQFSWHDTAKLGNYLEHGILPWPQRTREQHANNMMKSERREGKVSIEYRIIFVFLFAVGNSLSSAFLCILPLSIQTHSIIFQTTSISIVLSMKELIYKNFLQKNSVYFTIIFGTAFVTDIGLDAGIKSFYSWYNKGVS